MATTALERITDLTEEVTDLSNKARSYAMYQERFGNSVTGAKRFTEYVPFVANRNYMQHTCTYLCVRSTNRVLGLCFF